jgi:N-acetylmuramoyl-L-alanine amidase
VNHGFRVAAATVALVATTAATAIGAGAFALIASPSSSQVWVSGRQISFAHLAIAYGDPVAPADDPGIRDLLAAVAAKSSWQPGTRFVAVTRADGKLLTFTLGSNAVSVDGTPASMAFAPFTEGSQLYLPLLPLARALGLGVRGFRGGYAFVPQITAVTASVQARRTVVEVSGTAPLAWRSAIDVKKAGRKLTLSFPGFGTDVGGRQKIAGKEADGVEIAQSGPPGYPTTSVTISVLRGVKFGARRIGAGVTVDIVLARTAFGLRATHVAATPSSVQMADAKPTQPALPSPPAVATAPPSTSPPTPIDSPAPAPEPTDNPTAQPLGPETGASPSASPSPSALPTPSAPPRDQKITDVSVAETATGTRITLTLTGPVSFEWHRLIDPDNRYWLDIDHATLVGPAQTLESKLPFIKEVKVSQHLIVPDRVVRLSITPTQAVDVRVGAIEGSPNQLGIEIENQPPGADAPMAGMGSLSAAAANASAPSSIAPASMEPDLIVIDPGHGGTDPGSLNPAYGLTESKLTLDIARRLAANLKRQGWRVTLTRTGDYDVGDPFGPDKDELQARCDVANAAGARLFVSIHINASVSSAPNGTTTYYWHPQDRAFALAVQTATVAAAGITNDGIRRYSFYVIHHTSMPSILVETAYLSNPHDAELLRGAPFLDKLAAGIARGIAAYTGGPQSPVGQTKPLQNAQGNY